MFNLRHCIHYIRYIHYIQLATCLIRVSGKTHSILQHTATHCGTLRHTATHCNTLQHNATDCHTLQHTAFFQTRCFLIICLKNSVFAAFQLPSKAPYVWAMLCRFYDYREKGVTNPSSSGDFAPYVVSSLSLSLFRSFFLSLSLSLYREKKKGVTNSSSCVGGSVCRSVCCVCCSVC